mmetsp:Transcript_1987/g.5258  ORF Transcript_1987/g.5258 Transcript_1987/m.5258 type:complete len:502 (-) Transcript_1987:233-1738(-)
MTRRQTVLAAVILLAVANMIGTGAHKFSAAHLRKELVVPPDLDRYDSAELAGAPNTPSVMASRGGGARWPRRRHRGGSSTISESVSNLVKSIVGVGILGVPAGVAAFGDSPGALVPALAAIIFMGLVSAYTFGLIGQVCSWTGASSYGEAWEKSVGTRTAWIPSLSCTIDCFGGNISFSMVLADTFKRLFEAMTGGSISRTNALLVVTVFVLLPLCLLKNLSSLAPFSLLGCLGTLYTLIAMGVRYFDGSYQLPHGKFIADIPAELQPVTEGMNGASSIFDPRAFILVSMLSKSFSSHFVAPQFHAALLNNTPKRFSTVVLLAFGTSILCTLAVTSFGYLTFGGSSSGLILSNYSPRDKLIGLSYAAAGVSILFSYPLCFAGGRDGLIDLAGVPSERRTDAFRCLVTVLALAFITATAAFVTDLSTSLALRGATLGNALVYIYPALMFRAAVASKNRKCGVDDLATIKEQRNVRLATACGILGVGTGILGTKIVLERWRGS